MSKNVQIGVGVFVFRNGKFLMQKRRGSHGEGTWSVPGGHLEYSESPEDTSHREVFEETNCEIKDVRFAAVTNDVFIQDQKHYLTLWTTSTWSKNEPSITEPDKCSEQLWTDFDHLPEPLFLPWQQLLRSEFIEPIKLALDRSKDYKDNV